ncbi:DUF2779 domain-containing protein [Flavihumibacter sp. RY-1]|uniref:DUF2779 domain-containing protein n=1 Tax=Flavihumibacter fluminis TaxID=2909236 RepID=A0ABS9BKJ9_9BACT|nr:DUF2779 domain-containing protein [Flavihumibacter fluminis]MCF1715374.1 DUF2779 domain-containing protein [Flavihumibacter fluminis]
MLTKTDFIKFLDCAKSLWLMKNDPENFPSGDFSAFLQKLIKEGYEVEAFAKKYFEQTPSNNKIEFQKVLEAELGLYTRVDIIVYEPSGEVSIYEVKSSTRLKKERGENHIKDACFQVICAELCGYKIKSVSIVHLNGNYIRSGEIETEKLFTIVDVTTEVRAIKGETFEEIKQALLLLAENNIDRTSCDCVRKSRANHCDSFTYFNQKIPEYSIYCLPRLSDKKRLELLDNGSMALEEVPDDFQLSPQQAAVLKASKKKEVQINKKGIITFIESLAYPLYFFDYETFCSAIPIIDRVKPHQHIPVQYSLHRLDEDGTLSHFEYLATDAVLPFELIQTMRLHIGPVGSIISWYDTFEKTRNKEMALLYPEHAEFLNDVNRRMVNLEDVFKTDYVDMRFKGSTSIKKVLPVVCPNLSYSELEVQDGTSAMDVWSKIALQGTDPVIKESLKTRLLEYCKLDTMAMVEIFNMLQRTVAIL